MLEWRQCAGAVGLVEKPPRLHLDVLAVSIRQQVLPDHPFAREAPDPDLPARLVAVVSAMGHAEVLVVPIAAEEFRQPAQHMIRLVAAKVVVLIPREVAAGLRVDGPIVGAAVVADETGARMDKLQVAGGLEADVHPRVVGLIGA